MLKKHKILILVLAFMGLSANVANAQATSGQCGDSLYWSYNDSVLTITGTGDMTTDSIAPWNVFYNSITSVSLPNGITSIGDNAFAYCFSLTSITMPDDIITIGRAAFFDCRRLTSIIIPNSVTTIGNFAFAGCTGLTSVTIGHSVTSIGDDAFQACIGLTSITIPNSVTSIGQWAFFGCPGLTSITIPNSVTSIGYAAFQNFTGSTTVNFNATNCTAMDDMGTFSSALTTLNIGDNVICIPAYAFVYCRGLTSVTIPNSVDSIGDLAFFSCRGLTSLTIGNSVTSIGDYAFQNCDSLTSVINLSLTPQIIDSYVFWNLMLSDITLYVPTASFDLYQEADVWKEFNVVALPEMSENDISFTPSDSSAVITWQIHENAEGYRLIIYADEAHLDTICVVEFDVDGTYNIIKQKAKSQSANNISYTVENLLSGIPYYYTLEILGINNVVLASHSGQFDTDEIPAGVVETQCIASLPEIAGYYSILGQKLPKEPASGLYIIMYDNGKTEKVLK